MFEAIAVIAIFLAVAKTALSKKAWSANQKDLVTLGILGLVVLGIIF